MICWDDFMLIMHCFSWGAQIPTKTSRNSNGQTISKFWANTNPNKKSKQFFPINPLVGKSYHYWARSFKHTDAGQELRRGLKPAQIQKAMSARFKTLTTDEKDELARR